MALSDSPAARIVAALGGRNGRANCPLEKHRTPLSLSVDDGKTSAIVVRCHAGCSSLDVLRELRRRGLLEDGRQPATRGFRPRRQAAPPDPAPDKHVSQICETSLAPDYARLQWLLGKLLPIEGTLVETYLRSRGVDPPRDGHHLRYLPASPPKHAWPCMVGIVTDFADAGRVLSLHFTELMPDGTGKAPVSPNKRMLGGYPVTGGVVRLCENADVTLRLGIAEGIEKALSIATSHQRDLGYTEQVWSALSAGTMARLPVVPGIETLAIYGDKNAVGRKAAAELKKRWLDAGREVETHFPPGDDWDEAP